VLFSAFVASPALAQAVVGNGGSSYIMPDAGEPDSVGLSITTTDLTTSPFLSVVDESGFAVDCQLPCTIRARAGHLSIRGDRLDAGVDVYDAGLTYDVTVAPGASADVILLSGALALGGGLVAGLSIWGLTEPGLDEDLFTLAAVGAVLGGLFFVIGLPLTIWMLATYNGEAHVTGYRVSGAVATTEVRF
jgi:hypothetical protein